MKKLKTIDRYQTYFDTHIDKESDPKCWLWTAGKNNIGYGLFRYQGKMQTAHRVQAMFHGIYEEGKCVLHTCDNKHCVNPEHLFAGTMSDMAKYRTVKGRSLGMTGRYHKIGTCPHCKTEGPVNILGRNHFDKCPDKPV